MSLHLSDFVVPHVKGSPVRDGVYANVIDDTDLFNLDEQFKRGGAFLCMRKNRYDNLREKVLQTPLLYMLPFSGRTFFGVPECMLVDLKITEVPDSKEKPQYHNGFVHCLVSGHLRNCASDSKIKCVDNATWGEVVHQTVADMASKLGLSRTANIDRIMNELMSPVGTDRTKMRERVRLIRELVALRVAELRTLFPNQFFYFPGGIDYLHIYIGEEERATDVLGDRMGLYLKDKIAILPRMKTVAKNCGWKLDFNGEDEEKGDAEKPIHQKYATGDNNASLKKLSYDYYRTIEQGLTLTSQTKLLFSPVRSTNIQGRAVMIHDGKLQLDSVLIEEPQYDAKVLALYMESPQTVAPVFLFWVDFDSAEVSYSHLNRGTYTMCELASYVQEINFVAQNHSNTDYLMSFFQSASKSLQEEEKNMACFANGEKKIVMHLKWIDNLNESR